MRMKLLLALAAAGLTAARAGDAPDPANARAAALRSVCVFRDRAGLPVLAEQWGAPRPFGPPVRPQAVRAAGPPPLAPRPYVVSPLGRRLYPREGEWVVADRGGYSVWADADFRKGFTLDDAWHAAALARMSVGYDRAYDRAFGR